MRHHLDFCCGGKQSLEEACRKAGLDAGAIVAEIEREVPSTTEIRWDHLTQGELADHIENRYHAAIRRDVPPLVEAARKVERVHAQKPDVPAGLADVLSEFLADMERHMQKEEKILFPMLRRGLRGEAVYMPVRTMESEHESHAEQLARIRQLTKNLQLPSYACATWTALYRGLEAMESELHEHIHLENNILFSRAIRGVA